MHRYFIINKPYNMVSQFISPDKVGLLGELNFDFPEGTHAIGRLDNESEGLLILTTNKQITRKMFLGKPHTRSYLVMVQNEVSEETLYNLQTGVKIKIKNGEFYIAKPESIEIISQPTALYTNAVDPREKFPHTWLLITLTEGKFRQVRKMVLAVRHRCLRLIRVSIAGISLDNMKSGEVKELDEQTFFTLAEIEHNSTSV